MDDWLVELVTQGPPGLAVDIEPGYEYEYVIPSTSVVVTFFVLVSPVDRRIGINEFHY
ncbi:MAG TPA: hypothetical protein VFA84_03340 [Acidimicrobiales bacterium]|nr:hypothetical protein [Acidimicrobiales bacterium]